MTVVLETTGLMKSFGGVQVIDDLSMQLNDGEALGIVGPNGAGKTTLFNLITGLFHADEGTISFQGKSLVNMAPQDIAALGDSSDAGILGADGVIIDRSTNRQVARPFARLHLSR
mgnify:CR=1 FL=1